MSLPESIASNVSGTSDSTSIAAILERLGCCIETLSLGFDGYGDAHVKGPGLYFVLARGSIDTFAHPMGANRWPVDACPSVFENGVSLFRTARTVARSRDGAVVVNRDGTIEDAMVRLTNPSSESRGPSADLPFAGWMGARHMSALETSAREAVAAAITLSEEDGRMTVFRDGDFEDYPRSAMLDGQGVCD